MSGAALHQFADLGKRGMSLKKAGVENGTIIFALYSGERNVQPVYRKSKFEERLFGVTSLQTQLFLRHGSREQNDD